MKETKFNSIQSNKVLIFVEFFLNYFPVALATLMPVFFLTTFTDYFEQGKFVLFLVGTISLAVFWVLKLLLRSSVYITKSKLDVPIWLYILVFGLSSFLSVSQVDSLYGTQVKWVPSLLSVITFVLYFYTVSTNMRSLQAIKYSIFGFIVGGTISSVVVILSYFGIKLGSQAFLQNPVFNLVGSLETAGLVAAVSLLLSLSVLFNTKEATNKTLSLISTVINLITVTLIWHFASLILVLVGVIYLVSTSNITKIKAELSIVTITAVIWIALLLIPGTSKLISKKSNFNLDPTLNIQNSWTIAATVLRDKPFLGMGPNTFSKVYLINKPINMNSGQYWNYTFNRSYNQAFDELIFIGVVGILVAAFFYYRLFEIVKNVVSKKEEFTPIHQALLIPILGIPVYYLMAGSNTVSSFIFYNFLAIFVSVIAGFQKSKNSEDIFITVTSFSSLEVSDMPERKEKFQYFAILPILGIAGALGYYSSYNIIGEYYFRKSIDSALKNDAYGVYNNQINARDNFPRRDAYHTAIAQTNLNLAITLANKKDLTVQEKEVIQNLISESIRSTRLATENLDPLNLNNWLVRSSIYKSLIGITNDADQWTISALNNAIALDPVNPNIRLELGSIYFAKQDYLTAANLFKQATQLKGDYANAHYNLAQALKGAKIYDSAISELEIAKSLLQAGSADVARIDEEIKNIKNTNSTLGASTERKSVEQLESKTTANKEQGPLTNPSEVKKDSVVLEKAVSDITKTEKIEKK